MEILDLLARHDQTISEKLRHAPRNALYVSPDIQNSLLELMGEMVRGKISNEIDQAGYILPSWLMKIRTAAKLNS